MRSIALARCGASPRASCRWASRGRGRHGRQADDDTTASPRAQERDADRNARRDGDRRGLELGGARGRRLGHGAARRACRRGTEPEPWVELPAGSAHLEQYLDAGARGLRWLNLSGPAGRSSRPGRRWRSEAHGVAIEAGAATLRVFANRLDFEAPDPDPGPAPRRRRDRGLRALRGQQRDDRHRDVRQRGRRELRRTTSPIPPSSTCSRGSCGRWTASRSRGRAGSPPNAASTSATSTRASRPCAGSPNEVMPELYGPNTDVAPYRRANVGHAAAERLAHQHLDASRRGPAGRS